MEAKLFPEFAEFMQISDPESSSQKFPNYWGIKRPSSGSRCRKTILIELILSKGLPTGWLIGRSSAGGLVGSVRADQHRPVG